MKVNIFGVGRSGTKAIQLFISSLLARKYGKVINNYEPYYWSNRYLTSVDFEGVYHHKNTALISPKGEEISNNHKLFLKKKVDTEYSTVTKFIRGNGRIRLINDVTEPDFTIIVVRDIYSVLGSVAKKNWDLLGANLAHQYDYSKLVHEIQNIDLTESVNGLTKKLSNKLDKNALYWFLMNRELLKYDKPNVFYVEYKHLENINSIVKKMGLDPEGKSIRDNMFLGNNIHTDFPLRGSTRNTSKIVNMYYRLTNRLGTKVFYFPDFFRKSKSSGTCDFLQEMSSNKSQRKQGIGKANIEKNHCYSSWNNLIFKKLRDVQGYYQ